MPPRIQPKFVQTKPDGQCSDLERAVIEALESSSDTTEILTQAALEAGLIEIED